MSTIYKINDIVPTNVLANRLNELSDAVCKGPHEVHKQFDMRIPAELDRDADLVLSQSASRMTELEAQLVLLREQLAALNKEYLILYQLTGEVWPSTNRPLAMVVSELSE